MIRRLIALILFVSLLATIVVPSSGTATSLNQSGRASINSSPRTLVVGLQHYATLGSWLIDKLGGGAHKPERPAIVAPPVKALLNSPPVFLDAPTNLTVTSAASNAIDLSWGAPAGTIDHYQVERSNNISGPFLFLGNATSASYHDQAVSPGNGYLYRVRAIGSGGIFSVPSNMALGTAVSFEFSSLTNQLIKAQHVYDVRTAINAVRAVANLPAASWTRSSLGGLNIVVNDVQELRDKLDEALPVLSISVTSYQDPTLTVGSTLIRAIHLEQLQARSTKGVSSSAGPLDSDSSSARLDPLNGTGAGGENPLSRNFNWNLPLLNLSGRAGLNLGLTLSYNSLVWTKRVPSGISFDDDHGFPGPGFRLGFPVIQPLYLNAEVGKYAFLLINPDGSRIELRQVGSSALYESADSSHLLLDSSNMVLTNTEGTQLSYVLHSGQYDCTQIKDRNGNYITVNYNVSGRIDTITDTLGRVITFAYDGTGLLTEIKQVWNQNSTPLTHYWARFEYANISIDYNFGSLSAFGLADNSTLKTLSRVRLADDSYFDFSYSSWGQVWKVGAYAADNHLLNYRSYNLPQTASTAYDDCPRFTERRDWAEYWNGDTDGTAATNEEGVTAFAVPVSDTWTMPDSTQPTGMRAQVTAPDGTSHKIYFIGTAGTSSGWQRGLVALVNTYDSSAVLQRQVTTTWTQDNTALSYVLNPRVAETNVYDPAGNRARTQNTYQQFTYANGTSCFFPLDVYEWAANATTILRSTRTDYNSSTSYSDRHILGLVSEKRLYSGDVNNGGTLASRVGYFYDETGSIQGNDAPVQHDNTNFSVAFVTGRGNISSVKRYDVLNTGVFTTSSVKYNTAGAPVSAKDALNHEMTISYADSFSDSNNTRNTLAYPTSVTDADGYTTTSKYHFDFGAVTNVRAPQPNTTANTAGPEVVTSFDAIGRTLQQTSLANNAYRRYEYPASHNRIDTYQTIQTGQGEAHSFQITDGGGRVVATASDHPGSVGGFSGQRMVYDVMGRVIKTSTPAETTAIGPPSSWVTAGLDATVGWLYVQQTYDWKGRPLVTTNQDGTTRIASYAGCGCAGGEVKTLLDEGTYQGTTIKRRQTKTYTDVLGREVKTETFIFEGGSIYSTTVNTFNVRDQITQIREFAGSDASTTFQDTTRSYDGYGRLQSEHRPEHSIGTAMTWTYNNDDTIDSLTDARGAAQTFAYDNRHHTTSITYSAPFGITVPTAATFSYDAVGNRLSATDGYGSRTYQYDSLSRLTQETRQLPVGSFSINYTYNLIGQLMSVTDPFNDSISYTRNVQGQLKTVTGSPFGGTTNYITDVQYTAWGAPRTVNYPGSSATTSYGFRPIPTQYLLTGNSGSSIMRENYSYHPDGQIIALTDLDDTAGNNPPQTLRFLSRGFFYDHMGRITSAYGNGNGGQGVPFSQSYGYDEFGNMTSRSGVYYSYNNGGFTNDTSTYVNNRRTNWTYNADGQPTNTPLTSTDRPRAYTYDAAGRLISSVEQGQFNTITYTAGYDGDGQVVFESSTTSPGTSESNYIIRSTALGGEVLTRLDQSGNKKITFVPAEGLLFATQRTTGGPTVLFTMRNPLGLSETTKAVYDPLGNYIPFQQFADPRPPAGSYNSGSLSSLSASQANPFSSAVGCLMDGLPTTCTRVAQAINSGQGKRLIIDARGMNPNVALATNGWFLIDYKIDSGRQRVPPRLKPMNPNRPRFNGNKDPYNVGKDEGGVRWGVALIAWVTPQYPTDPKTIKSQGNSSNCKFTVNFDDKTSYNGDPRFPNGPSSIYVTAPDGTTHNLFGLGFTVSGSVTSGGIGTIGSDSNPQNPSGTWTIDQWTSSWNQQNGHFVVIDGKVQNGGPAWRDINKNVPFKAGDNNFSWYDHPSGEGWGTNRFQNFTVKIYRGKEYCQADFHFIQINSGPGYELHWAEGLLK